MPRHPTDWTVDVRATTAGFAARKHTHGNYRGPADLRLVLNVAVCAAGPPASSGRGQALDQLEFFERQVRPLLVARCYECHGEKKSEAHLRLTSRELILKGGESGPAAVPGKPDESRLCNAIDYIDEPRMPPSAKLSAGEIATLKRWVTMGLPWPRIGLPCSTVDRPVPQGGLGGGAVGGRFSRCADRSAAGSA